MDQFQAGRHHHVPTATSTGRQEERGRENGEVTGEDTEVQEVASPVRSQERRRRRCGSAMWSGDVVLSSPQMFLPSGSYRLVHLHSVVPARRRYARRRPLERCGRVWIGDGDNTRPLGSGLSPRQKMDRGRGFPGMAGIFLAKTLVLPNGLSGKTGDSERTLLRSAIALVSLIECPLCLNRIIS